jgi:ABC-2 type transport system permease protein
MQNTILRVAKKEITLFFASPIAYLFLATFALITLFIFFWGEAFFARNIADVRPLFEWMPVLLIFLSAALTMRLWSEERRTGTLEHVLTQSVPLWYFVLGKFLGCLFLLFIALLITLPLPISVAILSDVDWGPVWAGYLATFLVGAAYLSIGLFISARSENQIVSLISASALCGLFYLVGTSTITDLMSTQAGEFLRQLGTGSRFESITRGVIDFRDLYYYLSIVLVFLALNTFVLERERWTTHRGRSHHRQWQWLTGLLVANALGANLWLGQIHALRADVTEGNQYSISNATENYLNQLQEPLLLRGYFSQKTHPLLAPLVPQMRDLMQEYEMTGRGKVRVEFIDPLANPEQEEEANRQFGIQPVPFQVADRYQSSIVSSYFNVVVQYGDEHQVLGFRDLIEIQQQGETDIDVQLRNPEHDITRAIKKVLQSYQSAGNLFDTVSDNLTFTAYVSADNRLPEPLVEFKQTIRSVLNATQASANGQLTVDMIDPDADNGKVGQQIAEELGFKPMATSLFSDERFYFYLTLSNGEQIVQLPMDDMTEESFKRNLDAGIKRFAKGFTKTVALVTPESPLGHSPYGTASPFSQLESFLGAELNVQKEDLSDGAVAGDADILLLAAPESLSEEEVFAVDQFLMQGGTVIAATSPYRAQVDQGGLRLQEQESGLNDWLAHHGLTIDKRLVLDTQSTAFPIPMTRNIGGLQIRDMRLLDYPYFIDVRGKGLSRDNLITSELPQLTVPWASPISIDQEKNNQRELTELLRSSEQSWLSSSQDIMPKVSNNTVSAFLPEGEQSSHLLGVISEGRFDSFFAGKDSPLLNADNSLEQINSPEQLDSPESTAGDAQNEANDQIDNRVYSVIERSPSSARIILLASNELLSNQVIQFVGSAQRSDYLNSLQLAANAVDWSLEDAALLSIRSRGHFNRTLPPMDQTSQMFWEYLNYGMAALALLLIAFWERRSRRAKQRQYLELLAH